MNRRCRRPGKTVNRERARYARALTLLLGLSVCSFIASPAHANDIVRGAELYMSECSKCHGAMQAVGNAGRSPPMRALQRVALQISPRALAFALPYGPSLEGVYGREAGTFTGFEYSKAFRAALAGTIWDERTLDEYITDSQARAPGARMFYRQTDAETRRLIIEFLKSRR